MSMVKIKKKQIHRKFKKPSKSSFDGGRQTKHLIEHDKYGKWFEYQFDEVRADGNTEHKLDESLLHQAEKRAENLLHRETEQFKQWYRTLNRGDSEWLETVAQKGTFADRLSALQLCLQRSPVHAIEQLRNFVDLVEKKGAKIRQAHSVTKSLKELFIVELLPPSRKLCSFNQRPFEKWANQKGPEAEKRLILWHFEAQLKKCYRLFLDGLQSLAGNMVEGLAQSACQEMTELLIARPEQEQLLLSALVNRLGHPQHRLGAKVAQMLEQLVHKHPNMRSVVAKEVEQLMFRKNISPKAQRYGLHFLSRMLIDAGEFELALQLIQVYLRLFRILVLKDSLNEHRLLPLLIAGLNRAFPYAKGKTMDTDLLKDVESLYAIVQTTKFSTALSVLRLLFQIHSASDGFSDRFYCAFYRRLLNLPTSGSSEQMTAFFDLIQRVLKNDLVENRVRAFLKRLFQVALTSNSAFSAATLLNCHLIIKERPQLLRLDNSLSTQLIGGEDKKHSALNNEKKRLKKAKKNIEVTIKKEEAEEEEKAPESKASILEEKLKWFEENDGTEGDDEEEERYEDVKMKSDDEEEEVERKYSKGEIVGDSAVGWVHRRLQNGIQSSGPSKSASSRHLNGQKQKQQPPLSSVLTKKKNVYDCTARNPLFAGADFALDTELYSLARHYHPTVAMFARALIKGDAIHYKGDPLIDISHMRFLDRFAFKNPKTRHKASDGKEAKKPLFAHVYSPKGVKALNPTSQDYVSKKNNEIPVDERFLHHFAAIKFKKDDKEKNKKKKKTAENEDEADEMASLDSDEFDTLLEKFEPGESRDVFDVDFSKEFGEETDTKRKQKALKRKRRSDVDDEEDEGNEQAEGLAGSDIDSSDFDDEEEGEEGEDDDEFDDEEGESDEEGRERRVDEEMDDDEEDDDDDVEIGSDVDVRDFDDSGDDDDMEEDGEEEEEEFEFD